MRYREFKWQLTNVTNLKWLSMRRVLNAYATLVDDILKLDDGRKVQISKCPESR